MIEILNFKKVDKGAFFGSLNIKVIKWNIIFNKVSVFQKEGRRWIGLPQEVFEEKGEKKYFPLVKFDSKELMDKFQIAVLEALDEWIKKSETSSTPSENNDELPF